MGIAFAELFSGRDSESAGYGNEAGRPIGSASTSLQITARRSVLENGVVRFAAEEPLTLFPSVLRAITLDDGKTRGFLRCEVKANPKKSGPKPKTGDHIVVTERPYGRGWFTSDVFKSAAHRRAEDRLVVEAATLSEAIARLSLRGTDPWETGHAITASIKPPEPLAAFEDPARGSAASEWLFGVCESREQFVETLAKSQEAQRLLNLAYQNRLRLGPNSIPIHPRVAEDANAVLFVALNQALAGPRASTDLVGAPVMTLVTSIFEEHLYNRTRRAERQEGRLEELEE